MNLIENASKYAETKGSSGGKVEVKAHTREGYDVSAYVRSKPGQGVSLKQPISRYSSVDLEDVYNVKKALMSEGYYEPNPKLGLNEFTDEALFDGIQRFQKDNGLRVDGIMKPGGETEKKMNEVKEKPATMTEKAVYGLAGASQGYSLGFSDEVEGAINGVGHVIAKGADDIYSKIQPAISKKFPNAPKNIYYSDKGYIDAFKYGYKSQRDESRNLLEEGGYRRAPIVTGAAESAGAIASPIKFGKVSKTAPLTMKADKAAKGVIKSSVVYGIGSTNENKASEYAENIGTGLVGNYLGHTITKSLYGRAGNPIAREIYSQGSNLLTKKAKNLLEKDN